MLAVGKRLSARKAWVPSRETATPFGLAALAIAGLSFSAAWRELAAALAGKVALTDATLIILSGGNVDPDLFAAIMNG